MGGDQYGEERRQYPDQQGETKPLDGAGPEPDHDTANNQLHKVSVKNRSERFFKPTLIGTGERFTERQFFAHTLED